MARQKPAPRNAARKKVPRPPSATAWGRANILLEDMSAQIRAVAEAVTLSREEARRESERLEERIGERIAPLEFGLRDVVARLVAQDKTLKILNSKLDEHTAKLDEHTAKLNEHTRILDAHSGKLDEHTRRHDEAAARFDEQARLLADHSARLERIEAKLDCKADAEDLAALAERVGRLERAAAGS